MYQSKKKQKFGLIVCPPKALEDTAFEEIIFSWLLLL